MYQIPRGCIPSYVERSFSGQLALGRREREGGCRTRTTAYQEGERSRARDIHTLEILPLTNENSNTPSVRTGEYLERSHCNSCTSVRSDTHSDETALCTLV
jgi:hypothetical protein